MDVEVTITVKVGDVEQTFAAAGSGTGSPNRLAEGLLGSATRDAAHWLSGRTSTDDRAAWRSERNQ